MCIGNQQWLFDLQKSQGNNLLVQASDTNLPIMFTKKTPKNRSPKKVICMVPDPKAK